MEKSAQNSIENIDQVESINQSEIGTNITHAPTTQVTTGVTAEQFSNIPVLHNQNTDVLKSDHEETSKAVSIDNINNIPITLSAVLGKKKIDIRSLLDLERGSIVDIDKKIGDSIDLYINDHLVARGELIMIDGGLGVSMTEIVQTEPPSLTTNIING